MIKVIRYGYSEQMKTVIPVYIKTEKKEYAWSEPDLLYFDDAENMYSLAYITVLLHISK